MPMPRYTSRLGSPLREEIRTAATATSRTSEQTSRSWLRWWTVSGCSLLANPGTGFERVDVNTSIRCDRVEVNAWNRGDRVDPSTSIRTPEVGT
jgi:hypothetical protein